MDAITLGSCAVWISAQKWRIDGLVGRNKVGLICLDTDNPTWSSSSPKLLKSVLIGSFAVSTWLVKNIWNNVFRSSSWNTTFTNSSWKATRRHRVQLRWSPVASGTDRWSLYRYDGIDVHFRIHSTLCSLSPQESQAQPWWLYWLPFLWPEGSWLNDRLLHCRNGALVYLCCLGFHSWANPIVRLINIKLTTSFQSQKFTVIHGMCPLARSIQGYSRSVFNQTLSVIYAYSEAVDRPTTHWTRS